LTSPTSIDANHSLAGMVLQFVGEIVGIREATEEVKEEAPEGCCGHCH